ncbi:MAG: hypothetical protein HY093_01485 [Candidatus Liptonbacteria bacterium]|nr:hypothetical protein [Candidatus Liptonbacteria bacterium]
MTKFNKGIAVLGLGVGLFLMSAGFALGAGRVDNQGGCKFQAGDLSAIEAIRNDPKLEYLDKIKIELKLRQGILGKILNCAVQEANTLKSKLTATMVSDLDMINVRGKLVSQIDQAVVYYQSQAVSLGDLGLWGTKNLAKKLAEWRAGNYAYLVTKAVDLMTWANSQQFISLAEGRLGEIKKVVEEAKADDSKGNSLEIIKKAEASLSQAKEANQKAKTDIQDLSSSESNLDTIKNSLQALAAVYENFFELSEVMGKNVLQ